MMPPNSEVGTFRFNNEREDGRSTIFPCNDPINPQMCSFAARYSTFENWPGHSSISAADMVEAGLFSTGIGDKTKCFYCNGGLMNWEASDVPMEEHAKWYPQCEYVLQSRGCEFVSSITERFPGLNRPVIRTTDHVEFPVRIQNPQPLLQRHDSIELAMEHELVTQMKDLGFPEDTLKRVIERQMLSAEMFQSVCEFLDAIQNFENSERDIEIETTVPEGRVEIRFRELQEERKCKICFDDESDCVFHPCGHVCTCTDCARRVSNCPICRTHIMRIIRISLD